MFSRRGGRKGRDTIMAAKKRKVIVLTGGEKVPVLKEEGKYYLCQGRRFRKSNPDIQIEEVHAGKKKDEDAGEGGE